MSCDVLFKTKELDLNPQTMNSTSIRIILLVLVFPFVCNAQHPDCLSSWDYKKASLDKKIAKLESSAPGSNTYDINERGVKSALKSITRLLEVCTDKNTDIDFSRYQEELQVYTNKVENNPAAATGNMDESAYALKKILSYVENFPKAFFDEDDDTSLSLSDTKQILEAGKNTESNQHRVYSKYQQMQEKMNGSQFLDEGYARMDLYYSKMDDVEAIDDLEQMNKDLQYLKKAIFPDNKNLQTLVDYSGKLLGKKNTKRASAVNAITVSDFHKDNLNKIFFTSNLDLDPTSATTSDFKTDFTAGESIKGIAYLDNTIANLIGGSNMPQFDLRTGQQNNDFVIENYSAKDQNKGYVEFYIVQSASQYKPTTGSPATTAISMDFLGNLPPRAHSIDVTLERFNSSMSGTAEFRDVKGSFSFDASNEVGLAKMNASKSAMRDIHLESVPMPRAGQQNAAYERELVALFNSIGWEEKFTKTIIESTDWSYKRNYKGEIIGRTLGVYMFSTKNEGCMYQDFTVIQEKVGASWSNFKQLSTGGQTDISCKNVR